VCGLKDRLAVARYAGDLIADQVLEWTLLYAGQCDAYQTAESRALSARLQLYGPELKNILACSLAGQRVRGAQRRSIATRRARGLPATRDRVGGWMLICE
jgi:hypothetical protein